jgi:hypothetical protein
MAPEIKVVLFGLPALGLYLLILFGLCTYAATGEPPGPHAFAVDR